MPSDTRMPLVDTRYIATFYFPDRTTAKGATPKSLTLSLPLPEKIVFGASSTWEPFSAEGLLGLIENVSSNAGIGGFGRIYSMGSKATNNNVLISELSRQWWVGTEPINFNLDFNLVAFTDAKVEVMDKVAILMSLVLPRSNEAVSINKTLTINTLKAPPRNITLYLGDKVRFQKVIIKNVNVDFDTKCDVNGNFISAAVTVQVETAAIPNAEDFNFSGGVGIADDAKELNPAGLTAVGEYYKGQL